MKAQRWNWFVFNEEFHQKIKVDGGRFNKFDLKAEFTLQFCEITFIIYDSSKVYIYFQMVSNEL